ncbi:MAG: hypothetical protein JSU04_09710 [Bdellovibrionales bacterium]|nr:hypothetical protein [Bdellovibrionales bacterium]
MNRMILILIFTLLLSAKTFATDCGIKPKGMDFGPNCELVRAPAPPPKKSSPRIPDENMPLPQAPTKKRLWEPILFGAYSGKPGYYAMIGAAKDLKVDTLLMNEDVMEKAQKATEKLSLGGVTACEAIGTQQSIGYTLFDLRNCGGK